MEIFKQRVPALGTCQAGVCNAIPVYHRNITMVTESGDRLVGEDAYFSFQFKRNVVGPDGKGRSKKLVW